MEVKTSKGRTTKEGASVVSANHAKRRQRIRSMPTSSKSRPRKRGNDKEDTGGREAAGATTGEKPSKGGSPRTVPARNKAGRQIAEESVEGVRNPEDAAKLGRETQRARE